ncbi:MAG: sigma-54-dependent Fis family transcriptional regulator [Candidatus Aminicenantes bacterium]|nr:MAG: sigma-54-dependent Fis family transcriptional regulator [Candidatus Aminicenantes bacterium]
MIEVIKNKIWNLLKEKEISLAMIYDREGKILWHKGRDIYGKDVFTGSGFCRSYIEESLKNPTSIDVEDYIKSNPQELSKSAEVLLVKSIIIHPVGQRLFLYIDSGKKEFFTEKDRISFGILGELLEQIIIQIQEEADVSGITGASKAIAGIRDQVVKYSLEEDPVLITGETGVGKNHIAGLIHRYSGKKGKFVIVDTPNISDNLFESKLFGHKKGAFTDAKFDKTGLVEEAVNGTLFFDEITEVPLDVQAKLLRFIDTRKYYTLGESTEKEAGVRLIAATNRNLQEAVENKVLREDLYYRLNILEIQVPPLHERKEDIKNLLLENQILLRGKEIGPGFWDVIYNYQWPGNVRELLTVLKRAGIMLDSPITGEKISSIISINGKKTLPAKKEEGDGKLKEIREGLKTGKTFWQLIWRPFIARELDRNTVKSILKSFYIESSHSFKKMTQCLNVEEKDYKKFMTLLYKYKIDPRK